MPRWVVFSVKLFLDKSGDVLFNCEFIHSLQIDHLSSPESCFFIMDVDMMRATNARRNIRLIHSKNQYMGLDNSTNSTCVGALLFESFWRCFTHLVGTVYGVLLHVFGHVCILDDCFTFRHLVELANETELGLRQLHRPLLRRNGYWLWNKLLTANKML